MTRHTGLRASFRTRGLFTRGGTATARLSPNDQGSGESDNNHLAPGVQDPSGAAPALHGQAEQSVTISVQALRTEDVEVANAEQRGNHSKPLLTPQAEKTGPRGGIQEKKKRRNNPSTISNTAEPAGPLLEQPSTMMNGGSQPKTAVLDYEVLKEVKTDGVFRAPGVWDRRGVWVPALRATGEDAERAQEEGQLVGDRRRQRREDKVGA